MSAKCEPDIAPNLSKAAKNSSWPLGTAGVGRNARIESASIRRLGCQYRNDASQSLSSINSSSVYHPQIFMDFVLSCAYVISEALRAITPTPVYPACTLGA